ncbi:MAG TPA: tetratricopeptide repeat-containing diguanylate cyclase [Longimicrobiaceae bacterium]|nr:tetratricopeptide repeat-containing diguanylate cyclase [Longimicrobiaceae bacterium]
MTPTGPRPPHRPWIARLGLLLAICAATAVHAQQAPPPATPAAMVERAERMASEDDSAALALTTRALPMLARPADAPLRLRALRVQCWASAGVIEGEKQVAMADAAMRLARALGDARALADMRVCRGYGQVQAGRMPEGRADYEAAVGEATALGDRRLLADASLFRGELRYDRGDFSGALADLKLAYDVYARMGPPSRQRYALNSIANLYADRRVGQYDRALEYYRQLLAANLAAGLTRGVSTAYYNLGSTLEARGDSAGALPYYLRSLRIERQRGDREQIAYDQQAIGVVLNKLGRPAEALRWLDQSLAYEVGAANADRIPRVRLSRAVALRGLRRHAEALRELDAVEPYFARTHNVRYLEKIHDERARDLAATGDWAGAYRERNAQMALLQAMAAQLGEEQTSRLRVQFDSERKEAENRALTSENRLRGKALADAARIQALQRVVMLLALTVAAVLALLVARHVAGARRLRELASTDELTRLPNRRHLLAIGESRVAHARRRHEPLSVLALDVDRFKAINDTHGHLAGDVVLARVAQAVRGALREGDSVGRTGGEEFIALLPGADREHATAIAEQVREAVEALAWSDVADDLHVTVSVGVAERADGEDTFAAVARRADDSLYRAKKGGRNRVELAAV